MPIIIAKGGPLDGQPVLRCINHDSLAVPHERGMDPKTSTTMEAEPNWLALVGVLPPQQPAPGIPIEATQRATFHMGYGQAVRCYTCTVCGYVEMYDAFIVAPDVWKRGG